MIFVSRGPFSWQIHPPYNDSRVNGISAVLKYSITGALFLLVLVPGGESEAHNMGNAILWNREVSRIFYQRCASCHRDDGTAFPLMEYREVQPHAAAIKDAVLSRRM